MPVITKNQRIWLYTGICFFAVIVPSCSQAASTLSDRQFVPLIQSEGMVSIAKGIASSPKKMETAATLRNFIPLGKNARSTSKTPMISLNGGSAGGRFISLKPESPRQEKNASLPEKAASVKDDIKLAMLLGPEKGFAKDGTVKTGDKREMIAAALAPVMENRAGKQLITKEPVAGQAAPILAESMLHDIDEKVAKELPKLMPNERSKKLAEEVMEYESVDIQEEELENAEDISLPDAAILGMASPEKPSVAKSEKGFVWPVDGDEYIRVSSAFGMRRHPVTGKQGFHAGIDIPAPVGTFVVAAMDGEVTGIGTHKNLGRFVKISHEDGSYSLYGHLNSQLARMHAKIKAGQRIGTVGATGRATGPHLDFSIRKDGKPVNPMPFLADALQEKKLALAE